MKMGAEYQRSGISGMLVNFGVKTSFSELLSNLKFQGYINISKFVFYCKVVNGALYLYKNYI